MRRTPCDGPTLEQTGIASEIKLECKKSDIASDIEKKISASQKIPRSCIALSYRNTPYSENAKVPKKQRDDDDGDMQDKCACAARQCS
jgi:hypothetical protein